MAKLILVISILACSIGGVAIGKEFTLKKNESASVKWTPITVKMLSAGTSQSEAGGDSVFCEAEISVNGKAEKTGIDVGSKIVRSGYAIKVVSVDTKSDPKLSDPWSVNSCSFVVTKAEK